MVVGVLIGIDCGFLNPQPKGAPMNGNVKMQRTPLRMRTGIDAKGNTYELQECRELVSIREMGVWSPWAPFNGHGEAMTCNDVDLERISSGQWSLGYPPVVLTLLE